MPTDDHGIPVGATAYLVGGAVRDQLLGEPGKDRDWVVIGATPQGMLDAGFNQVGRDFPVFLHPLTREEYAIARTERKTGPGHTGFAADIDNVTLAEDLARRDLTINAIAQGADGAYVDPHQGRRDLANRILRHVSAAFSEDPLRVLRLARFAARLRPFGFTVAPETRALCQTMAARGDLQELAAERVWDELYRALATKKPMVFLTVLQDVGALSRISPLLRRDHLAAFDALLPRLQTQDERAVYLFSRLGPGRAREALDRLRAPGQLRELTVLVAEHYPSWGDVLQLEADAADALLSATDAYRRQDRFDEFSRHCSLYEPDGAEKHDAWSDKLIAALSVDTSALASKLKGSEVGAAIRRARIEKLKT